MSILTDATDALKIAKITMMMMKSTVYYTTILFSLKQAITEDCPTAATDGRSLLINPNFFNDLTPNERIGLLAHEVLHVAFDHMHRIGTRDPQWWNIAADYVINGFLSKAKYSLPKGGLIDAKYDGMTTEAVYDILVKKNEQEKANILAKCGSNPMNGGDVSYPDQAASGTDPVTQDEVTTIILRAATQAKMAKQEPGSIPGEVEIELANTLNPPLPWHVILQNYLTDFAKDDYSFRRPNKRFLPAHYMPVAHSEALPHIAIAVDSSSSVSDDEFNVFISKIAEIQQSMHPKKITVIDFNTVLKSTQELRDDQNPFKELKFVGRGGTRIQPVHDWVAEHRPTLILVFTDGEFTKTKPVNPNIPILWIIHDDPKWTCDHGRTIHYNIKKK
jgi:predicted metal-dependent peptidase